MFNRELNLINEGEDIKLEEIVKRVRGYIELFIESNKKRGDIDEYRKYEFGIDIVWTIYGADGGEFIIGLDKSTGTMEVIGKPGLPGGRVRKSFHEYMLEIMGNGKPRLPRKSKRPN